MFPAIIQLMLLGLLFYIVWNTFLKEVKPKKMPPPPPAEIMITQLPPKEKPPEGKTKIVPRDYLAWFGMVLISIYIFLAFTTPDSPSVIDFSVILTFALKPLGLALFLLFLTVVVEIKAGKITDNGKNYIKVALVVLIFFGLPIISSWLAQQGELEAFQAAQVAVRREEHVSAIVLLGQDTTQLKLVAANQVELTDTSDRIVITAREYQRQLELGSRPVVVVSAGSRTGYPNNPQNSKINLIEARDIARLLVEQGIPRSAIILEPTGTDFRNSALAVQNMINDGLLPERRVILIGPALGMQRARQTFAKLGVETLPTPAGFLSFQTGTIGAVLVKSFPDPCKQALTFSVRNLKQLKVEDFIPNVNSLLISNRVVNEFWTAIYYYMRNWLSSVGAEPVPQKVRPARC
jgi:uncharacterized SAM-binding protein YcdF (DUF218 family)